MRLICFHRKNIRGSAASDSETRLCYVSEASTRLFFNRPNFPDHHWVGWVFPAVSI